jgi:hypothetical protein
MRQEEGQAGVTSNFFDISPGVDAGGALFPDVHLRHVDSTFRLVGLE